MPHRAHMPLGWLVMVGTLSGTAGMAIDLFLAGLPQMATDLGVSTATVELTMTFLLVGLAVGQLVAGPISDARGRHPVLVAGALMFIVGNVLCAVAPGIELLLAARLLTGIAGGTLMVIANATVRDHYSGDSAARAFSLVVIASGVAPMLAPVVGAGLLRFTNWRGTFVALAIIGVIVLVCIRAYLPESLPRDRRNFDGMRRTWRDLRVLVTDSGYVRFATIMALSYACMFVYVSNSSPVLQGTYGLSPTAFALAFGANALGLILLSQVGGRLVHRVGSRSLLLSGILLATAGALGVLVSEMQGWHVWAVIVSFGIVISSFGLISPNSMAMALSNQGERAGSASAIIGASRFAVGGALAPLASLAAGALVWGTGAVMLALSALSLLVLATVRLSARRSPLVLESGR